LWKACLPARICPAECCDGIFIRNVYHHFADQPDPPAKTTSLWRTLKPGGRLAVIDFKPVGSEAPTPAQRDGGDQHGVLPETVSRELVQAGFTLISSEDRPDRWFIVVVEKRVGRVASKGPRKGSNILGGRLT
jgi:predicted methyltransferase